MLDCNTLASIGAVTASERDELIKAVRDSGVTAIKSTLGGATGTFEEAVADIAAADQLIEDRPDVFLKVRTIAELKRCKPEKRMGVIYSFEAASPLGDQLDRITLFRGLGVRVMQLCYNRKTPFGVGCLDGETGGLTELGRQAIAKMNELGVAVDLSHANTQTTAEGIAASKKPPIITHAGCRAVYMHPRNKEDRELKALADKGGVIGIYMLPFLTPSPKQPMLADYMQHMEHALKVCGEDHVGVGSDVPFQSLQRQGHQGSAGRCGQAKGRRSLRARRRPTSLHSRPEHSAQDGIHCRRVAEARLFSNHYRESPGRQLRAGVRGDLERVTAALGKVQAQFVRCVTSGSWDASPAA